ncbi:putative Vacuolar protein sorting-associated protein 13C [Hibiscus syriacus]|uniref:Vacuolar protein sorting-associated protein 13C n=1 Tax=Hibiscus syriacus TaxID=106335 RepID=A0A6A2XDY0_HIBSY|nr:putative Vacuolar protein sorting-associated protein 13C [Hibiscus syriacus]
MEFMVSKAQGYVNYSPEENDGTDQAVINGVSRQLQIKASARSSPEGLDKGVVLRRIRYHKCKSKVQSAFQALVQSSGQGQEKLMEMGDAFTSP